MKNIGYKLFRVSKKNKVKVYPLFVNANGDIPVGEFIEAKCGEIEFMNEDYVWCKCEYTNKINYQLQANENGKNKKGVVIHRNAYLKDIPYDGYYRYKTNPNMYED